MYKKYYLDNRDQILNNLKIYKKKNRSKLNSYFNNRYNSDINFRLIHITRCRLRQALKGNLKPSSTINILGIDNNLYKKLIKFQMTPDMNWLNINIDHVKPICIFDVSNDEELKEVFNWKNTQPLLKEVHAQKGTKFNVRL